MAHICTVGGFANRIVGKVGSDHATTKRHSGNYSDTELSTGVQKVSAFLLLDLEIEGRVVQLDGVDVGDLLGTMKGRRGYSRESDVFDLALAKVIISRPYLRTWLRTSKHLRFQLSQSPHSLFNGCLRIGMVHIVWADGQNKT